MKKIMTIAAVAALATLTACGAETTTVPADENATEVATDNAAEEAPGKGGPCGDGTVLRENEQCR